MLQQPIDHASPDWSYCLQPNVNETQKSLKTFFLKDIFYLIRRIIQLGWKVDNKWSTHFFILSSSICYFTQVLYAVV